MRHPDFETIVGLFSQEGISLGELARRIGVAGPTVVAWIRRDSIPVEYWDAVISAASKAGISGVSIDSLMGAARIAKARKAAPDVPKAQARA
jgi:hypothetical protein